MTRMQCKLEGPLTADCFPHEHVAFSAQTQEPALPQQVAGLVTILTVVLLVVRYKNGLISLINAERTASIDLDLIV